MSEETRCRICGRRLTVPESVKREIGPVCWGRFKSGEITPVTAALEDFCNQALKKEEAEGPGASSLGLGMGLSSIPKKEAGYVMLEEDEDEPPEEDELEDLDEDTDDHDEAEDEEG